MRSQSISLDLNARRTTTQLPSENSQQNIKHSDPKLTPLEIDGLKVLCTFLTKLKDKSIPSDIQQAPELLETMEVHQNNIKENKDSKESECCFLSF